MALYLPDSDTLFVHIPKCGGHYVEKALGVLGVTFEFANPIKPVCHRHGKRSDYKATSRSFCTMRSVDSWMKSYWTYHVRGYGNGSCDWQPGIRYYHRAIGPPMIVWQEFVRSKREASEQYLKSISDECDTVLNLENINDELCDYLTSLGYNIDKEILDNTPKENVTRLKVELGGGSCPRSDGFVNVDLNPDLSSPHYVHDLERFPWPFPEDSVDELYSSHCLEHLSDFCSTIHEICRVCKVGASVTITVPHPNNTMAMCPGHLHVISETQMVHFDEFPQWWTGKEKRLKLKSTTLRPSALFEEARGLATFQDMDDDQIMRFVSGTCHDSTFVLEVVDNR